MSLNEKKPPQQDADQSLDPIDRRLVELTQKGLPLDLHPYRTVAQQLALEEAEVIDRLQRLMDRGVVRRIGLVPNHYKLGYRYNAMTVWDVPDEKITELGEQVGALPFVSHSYERPRALPLWPYNLFAMVHGRSEAEVEEKVAQLKQLLEADCRQHQRLYSRRILKKTGMRIKQRSNNSTAKDSTAK
ncbi:Lrp/AsnC family transcriptional regulator [Motiliproteus sp.]|uniref:siroheme decarboxylase subunit beta n=1 Tax=Motiliproteus sp. TaxID=1898955 RepID=UPI003BAA4A1D